CAPAEALPAPATAAAPDRAVRAGMRPASGGPAGAVWPCSTALMSSPTEQALAEPLPAPAAAAAVTDGAVRAGARPASARGVAAAGVSAAAEGGRSGARPGA